MINFNDGNQFDDEYQYSYLEKFLYRLRDSIIGYVFLKDNYTFRSFFPPIVLMAAAIVAIVCISMSLLTDSWDPIIKSVLLLSIPFVLFLTWIVLMFYFHFNINVPLEIIKFFDIRKQSRNIFIVCFWVVFNSISYLAIKRLINS